MNPHIMEEYNDDDQSLTSSILIGLSLSLSLFTHRNSSKGEDLRSANTSGVG